MLITTKATKRAATRVAAVALTATALCGLGSVAAFADTPTSGALPLGQVTNLTPYTWTLDNSEVPNQSYAVDPPKSLAPGQTASWSHPTLSTYGFQDTSYFFTDPAGVRHCVLVREYQDGTYATDAEYLDAASNTYREATDFHLAGDPDGHAGHYDALWNSPTTVKIDNNTDPADAAAAVNYDLPRAVGDVKWTPSPGAKATFQITGASRATSLVYNHSDAPATVVKGHDTTKGQSTTLGEDVTASVSTKVFGFASKTAASVTSDQEWGSSDSVAVDVDAEVDPGNVGWIDKRTDVASLTGELVFTTPEGITFDVSNVSISKGDIVNPNGQLPSGVDYQPDEQPLGGGDAPSGTGAAPTDSGTAPTPQTLPAAAPGQMVVIDAATDKGQAVSALKLFESATDRSFTPSAAPQYQQTTWAPVTDADGQPASSVSGNAKTGQSMTQRINVTHETSSSWSLGGSIEQSVGFDLVEAVDAEMSVKLTANHSWESSSSDSQGIWVTAKPGKTVWIEAATSMASYTGDFAFTSNGMHYLVKNVTITQPAAPDADAFASTSYRVMQVDSVSQAGLPADTTGGVTPINSLPALQNYIGQGH
jgi:hypothetical protein